jgi:hypothetical protein
MKDTIAAENLTVLVSDDKELVEYNRQNFHYNTYLPQPYIAYSPDDGYVGGLGMDFTFFGFGEKEYKDKFYGGFKVSSEGNFQVKVRNVWSHADRQRRHCFFSRSSAPLSLRIFLWIGK